MNDKQPKGVLIHKRVSYKSIKKLINRKRVFAVNVLK